MSKVDMAPTSADQSERYSNLKVLLMARHAELSGRLLASIRKARAGEHGTRVEGEWGVTSQETVELQMLQGQSRELMEIEAAIGRIDLGQYGNCVDCGDEISERRLVAKPSALRCRECQEKLE